MEKSKTAKASEYYGGLSATTSPFGPPPAIPFITPMPIAPPMSTPTPHINAEALRNLARIADALEKIVERFC